MMKILLFSIFLIFQIKTEAQRLILKVGLGPTYSTFTTTVFGQYVNPEPYVNKFGYKLFGQSEISIGYRFNDHFSLITGFKWIRKGANKGSYNRFTGVYIKQTPWVDVIGYPIRFVYKPLKSQPFFLSFGIILGRMYTESSEYSPEGRSLLISDVHDKILTSGYINEFSSDLAIGLQLGKRFEIQLNWNQSLGSVTTLEAFGTIAVPSPGWWPNNIEVWNTNFGLTLSFNIIKNPYGK